MRAALAGCTITIAVIAGIWTWLGAPVALRHAPLKTGEKLYCVSYAPFRGTQTPFDPDMHIPSAQIEQDLRRLSKLADCVRIYAVDQGLEAVPALAAKYGLKVLLGFWLSNDPAKNKIRMDHAIDLANRYSGSIRAVVVGNEVLLRGDMTATALAETIRAVKARVKVPVTYPDVWEYWLRNRDLASAVDFITIHILPYWEDSPVLADRAAEHVAAIRQRVAHAFPGQEILIGEVGWPSAGRMRGGALPSRSNQARVIQDVLGLAEGHMFHVNIIEAYDAPWKRALEGTVGGHWGLLDDARRRKFAWGAAVSDHPFWRWQAAGGIAFALLVFSLAWAAGRGQPARPGAWLAVVVNAISGGVLIGWTIENMALESLGLAGWTRSLALAVIAVASPLLMSMAAMRGRTLPRLSQLIGPPPERTRNPLTIAAGMVLIATLFLAVHVALGLVFDPRYKDFPFAPLTAAIVPLLTLSLAGKRCDGPRGAAELSAAALVALSVLYIVPNEGLANWQSLWLGAALAMLAVSLARVRDAPG